MNWTFLSTYVLHWPIEEKRNFFEIVSWMW